MCNMFGYGEIKPSGSAYYSGTMLEVFSKIQHENFQTVVIERKEDLWPCFKEFLSKDRKRMVRTAQQEKQEELRVAP